MTTERELPRGGTDRWVALTRQGLAIALVAFLGLIVSVFVRRPLWLPLVFLVPNAIAACVGWVMVRRSRSDTDGIPPRLTPSPGYVGAIVIAAALGVVAGDTMSGATFTWIFVGVCLVALLGSFWWFSDPAHRL